MDLSGRSDDHVSLEHRVADNSPVQENVYSSSSSNPTIDSIGPSPEAYGWSSFLPEAEMPMHWGSNTDNLTGTISNGADLNWIDIDSGINLNDWAVPRHLTWPDLPESACDNITEGFNHFSPSHYFETQSIDNTNLVSNEFKLEQSKSPCSLDPVAVPSRQQWSGNIITTSSLKALQHASCGMNRPPKLPNLSSAIKEVNGPAPSSKNGKRIDSPTNTSDQPRKRPKQTPGTQEATTYRKLACPFFLRDREKHLDCLHFNLKRTKDVKQHVQRKHSSQNCQRDASLCDSQKLSPSGAPQIDAGPQLRMCPEAISLAQSHKLSMRNSVSQNEEEQWFKMWDILFPDASAIERPKTAYLGSDVEEIITTVRRVWKNKGHAALSSASTTTEGVPTGGGSSDMLDHVDRLLSHLSMVTRHETTYSASGSSSSNENHSVAAAQHSSFPLSQYSRDNSTRYINGRLVRDSWTETNEKNTSTDSGSDSPYIGSLANMTAWLLENDKDTYPGDRGLQLDRFVHEPLLDSSSDSENGSEDLHK